MSGWGHMATKEDEKKNEGKNAKKNQASTYSPADEPQYHRRESVLLPCSGWERVFPLYYGHLKIQQMANSHP